MQLSDEFIQTVNDAMLAIESVANTTDDDVPLNRIDRAIYKLGLVQGQLEAMRAMKTGNFDTGEHD